MNVADIGHLRLGPDSEDLYPFHTEYAEVLHGVTSLADLS